MAATHRDKLGLHESGSHLVMASPQEKAQCVLWYAESKSVVTVQRKFRRVYRKYAPTDKSIRKWFQQFQETGSVLKAHSPSRPCTSQDDTERIRVAFQRSPKRSVRHVSCKLQIPKITVHDVLQRRLKLRAYKLQLV
jgi:transposase-like protein